MRFYSLRIWHFNCNKLARRLLVWCLLWWNGYIYFHGLATPPIETQMVEIKRLVIIRELQYSVDFLVAVPWFTRPKKRLFVICETDSHPARANTSAIRNREGPAWHGPENSLFYLCAGPAVVVFFISPHKLICKTKADTERKWNKSR